MKKAAFTLIELIIAVTIIILLVAIGLPRFNDFNLRQDIASSAQKLASCIQQAQQNALAPSDSSGTKTVGYGVARIIYDKGTLSCYSETDTRNPGFDQYGSVTTPGALLSKSQTVTLDSVVACQAVFSYG